MNLIIFLKSHYLKRCVCVCVCVCARVRARTLHFGASSMYMLWFCISCENQKLQDPC